MAGSKLSLGVSIGGALDSSFGRTLSSAGRSLDDLSNRSARNRGLQSMIGDTLTLRRRMEELRQSGGNALRTFEAQHERNLARLKQHGVAVDRLEKEYQRLGKAARAAEFKEQGRAQIGRGVEQTKTGVQMGAAVGASLIAPTMIAAKYEATIRDIAIKGGIARTGDERAMSESIRKDATDNGMGRDELAEAVNTLVAGGMDWKPATEMAGLIANFSVGQNAETTDVASLILALRQAGVKASDTEKKAGITDSDVMKKALGKIAVAGDLGSFESKDMAKWFASLMPNLTGFGMSGDKAAVALSAMLQTQMSAAGSTDEAANNLRNLLGKITADDTRSKFKDKGIDYDGSMQAAITQGYDPVSAFLGLVEKSVAKTDPAKAKKMAELQERIAKTQDPAEAQKMLEGYLKMAGLSDFISDQQAKQAALAMLQNKKQHQQKLEKIKSTDGLTKLEQDLANRRAASANKWREAGNAVNESMARIGDTIMPLTNQVADGIKSIATAGSELIQKYPEAVTGLVAVGGAVAAIATARGAANLIGGAAKFALGGLFGVGKDKDTLPEPPTGLRDMAGQAMGRPTETQQVFVTNWPTGGFGSSSSGDTASQGSERSRWKSKRRNGAGTPSPEPPAPPAPQSRLGRTMDMVGKLGGKLGGALAIASAASQAYETYTQATSAQESAEGYGGAAGGLVGGLAGAQAGAMIGSMAGPIGTAVGGLIGGALGSIGGDTIGSWLGPEVMTAFESMSNIDIGETVKSLVGPELMSVAELVTGTRLSSDNEASPEPISIGETASAIALALAPIGNAVMGWVGNKANSNESSRSFAGDNSEANSDTQQQTPRAPRGQNRTRPLEQRQSPQNIPENSRPSQQRPRRNRRRGQQEQTNAVDEAPPASAPDYSAFFGRAIEAIDFGSVSNWLGDTLLNNTAVPAVQMPPPVVEQQAVQIPAPPADQTALQMPPPVVGQQAQDEPSLGKALLNVGFALAEPLGNAVGKTFLAWQDSRSSNRRSLAGDPSPPPNSRRSQPAADTDNTRSQQRMNRRRGQQEQANDTSAVGSGIDYRDFLDRALEAVEAFNGDGNKTESAAPQAATPTPQTLTFAPQISVTVQGDVKDPSLLASELMPHLQRLFDDFKSAAARTEMFDPAHV